MPNDNRWGVRNECRALLAAVAGRGRSVGVDRSRSLVAGGAGNGFGNGNGNGRLLPPDGDWTCAHARVTIANNGASVGSHPSNTPERMLESLLMLRHGVEVLGVDLKVVREISRMMLLRRLPGAPAGVLGAMDLRGQVIPVLDLEERLPVGASRPGIDNYLVVVSIGDAQIDLAIAATRIEDIEGVAVDAFHPAHTILPPGVPLLGVARTSQGWVPVLDPALLVGPGEVLSLREAVRRLTERLPARADEGLA